MSAAVIEAASEQPASRSGISTVFFGFNSLAVSAHEMDAGEDDSHRHRFAPLRAPVPRLSPTMSATV